VKPLRRLVTWFRRRRLRPGSKRILVPFTRGQLEPTVLAAAIRVARAEEATLVPAYLILVPMQFRLDAPMAAEVGRALPLLEAVEHAALRRGVPVDARVESGRTPIHALRRLWEVERFDRIIVPAPVGREPGFDPDELLWMLTHAPNETLILRPEPEAPVVPQPWPLESASAGAPTLDGDSGTTPDSMLAGTASNPAR
jgi:hypothetical protein